jgi:hypothetical protein
MEKCAQKTIDGADIVRDVRLGLPAETQQMRYSEALG